MTRLAKIKYTNSDQYYHYICNDKKIKGGEVVYVEGKNGGVSGPVYVIDIEEVERDCSGYKKVLSVAELNENVNISQKYIDITKIEADCIVNSLGPNTSLFGKICSKIVSEAHSKEIDAMLKKHPNANIFDTFITDAGDLKSNHIIHIVMPFKKDDDKYKNNLKKAFKIVIDLAIEKGYKSIAIPYIGTGANGYNDDQIRKALSDLTLSYQYTKDISIDIISVIYKPDRIVKTRVDIEGKQFVRAEKDYDSLEFPSDGSFTLDLKQEVCKKTFTSAPDMELPERIDFKDKSSINTFYYQGLKYLFFDEEEMLEYDYIKIPFDFFNIYLENKSIELDQFITYYPSKDVRSNIKNGKTKLSKEMVIQLAMIAEMNFTQTIQFMELAGYSFSVLSEEDVTIFNYMLANEGFENGITLVLADFEELNHKDLADKYNSVLCGGNPRKKKAVAA